MWYVIFHSFVRFGFNKWRDPMKPSQILARLCKDEGLDGPTYTAPGKCKIENRIFSSSANITDEAGRHLEFQLFCFG